MCSFKIHHLINFVVLQIKQTKREVEKCVPGYSRASLCVCESFKGTSGFS